MTKRQKKKKENRLKAETKKRQLRLDAERAAKKLAEDAGRTATQHIPADRPVGCSTIPHIVSHNKNINNKTDEAGPPQNNPPLSWKRIFQSVFGVGFFVGLFCISTNGVFAVISDSPAICLYPIWFSGCGLVLIFIHGLPVALKWHRFVLSLTILLCVIAFIITARVVNKIEAKNNAVIAERQQDHFNSTNILPQLLPKLDNINSNVNKGFSSLEEQSKSMDIGEEWSFANTLRPMAGMRVKLRSIIDSRAQKTCASLRNIFLLADWPILDSTNISEIGEDGVVIGCGRDEASANGARLLLKLLTERGVPSTILDDSRVKGVPTNAVIVAVCGRPIKKKAELMLVSARIRDLDDQCDALVKTMMSLAAKQYSSNDLSAAQAEYNDLALQFSKINKTRNGLSEQEGNLSIAITKAAAGTNSSNPMLILNGTTITGAPGHLIKVYGNPDIRMIDVHVNPPPLE